jgi:hypothetical protein
MLPPGRAFGICTTSRYGGRCADSGTYADEICTTSVDAGRCADSERARATLSKLCTVWRHNFEFTLALLTGTPVSGSVV